MWHCLSSRGLQKGGFLSMLAGEEVESGLQPKGSDPGQSPTLIETGWGQKVKRSKEGDGVISNVKQQQSDLFPGMTRADAGLAWGLVGGGWAEATPEASSAASSEDCRCRDHTTEAGHGSKSPIVVVSVTNESLMQVALPSLSACSLGQLMLTLTCPSRLFP